MKKLRRPVTAALLLAIGLLLPQMFHLFGSKLGPMLLPMHLSVLLSGFLLGPVYGGALGLLTPLLSLLLSGMPPMPLAWFMMAELGIYGVSAGVYYRKAGLPVFAALPLTQLTGRTVEALGLLLLGSLFRLPGVPSGMLVINATVAGVVGIVLQWLLVPLLLKALGRFGGKKND
ncbi:MAG: ECF transporter S component [Oscillospiraceae bacterium]|jgi:niacin transporter|nr:ECF transporter S component [Oscillospiraceae bacterium]